MTINIPGLVAVIVCYVAILAIGIYFGRRTTKSKSNEESLVADRNLGGIVSVCTIAATAIGGAYINGTAESAGWNGMLQTPAPLGYCIGFILAGLFYAPKMRREKHITMFDPFQLKFGRKVGALLVIPQILGDLFWGAAVLAALGSTISIILDINATVSILISAAVAIIYTFMGGLYSVAYTDVIQLGFIAVGLIVAFPFALVHPAVDTTKMSENWLGTIPRKTIGAYIDILCLTMFGGIPWQGLFQRVLACKTPRIATVSTVIASVFALLMGIPPMLMGIAGASADWNATSYDGPLPIPDNMKSFLLPLTLNYLSPLPIAIMGIGALSAAVMSSADSVILSTSSVITKNIFQDIFRPKASREESTWVLRISIVVVGTMATLIAIFAETIYGLFILCSDLMYVVLFPQLTVVLYMPQSNAYGSLVAFLVTFILRVLSGEPVIGLKPVIRFPGYDPDLGQLFPFRTFETLIGFFLIIVISIVTNTLFKRGIIHRRYDILGCLRERTTQPRTKVKTSYEDHDCAGNGEDEAMRLQENTTTPESLNIDT